MNGTPKHNKISLSIGCYGSCKYIKETQQYASQKPGIMPRPPLVDDASSSKVTTTAKG
jgi:hypothetical protein